jgi:hypothetical protein
MGRRRATALALLAGALLSLAAAREEARAGGAPGPGAVPPCDTSRVTGRVREGEAFEREIPGGLVFRLIPSAPPVSGWQIQVTAATLEAPEDELSWSVTPPLRYWNPRYLETSYGWTAQQAVDYGERPFRFVRPADLAAATEAVRALLWPGEVSADSLKTARARWEGLRVFEGVLRVLDARVEPSPDGSGRIAELGFEALLCVPMDPTTPGGRAMAEP